jgi:hypothetical protein
MKCTHLLSILLVSIFLYVGCKKEDKTVYIDPTIKQHFNFAEGSYWIYEDSATGKWDTFTVHSNSTSIKTDPPPDAATKREDLVMNTKFNDAFNSTYNLYIRLRGKSVGFYFDNLRIVFGATTSDLSNSGAYSSMQIGTTTIDSVVTSSFEKSSCSIHRDIGAVRIHLENDTISKTWMLVKWKTF